MSEERIGIGGLRDRVAFQRRETVAEDEGGQGVMFVPVLTTWARVTPLGARSAFAADARGSEITHSVVLRFRTDVKPGDRFVHRGRTLAVVSAEGVGGGRAFLGCRCREMAVGG